MKKRLLLYVFMLFAFLNGKAQVGHAFYVESGGSINLTNNIIIHNGGENLNIATPPFNLTGSDARVFMNAENNFFLYHYSPAVDAGYNMVCTWPFDLFDSLRIRDGFVDFGAFEYVNSQNYRRFAVHQQVGGHLTMCNNIIVNNPMHTTMTNMGSVSTNNILSDSVLVFRDQNIDFSLFATSPAVNAGQNSCNTLPFDIQKNNRISGDTIDAGAFEYYVEELVLDSVYVVEQNQEGTLFFCNNIDINNSVYSHNTNIQPIQANNIVSDNDSLFVDNLENFMPREGSQAIDAGFDACNTLVKDLAKKDRIMGESIDIGAFEQYVSTDDTLEWQYVVHQQPIGQLYLCNNIIVNNPAHVDVTNVTNVPDNNILSDSIPIFCDANLNFKPYDGSPAVDLGMNSCNGLAVDIDQLPRIARAAIDIGAFELPVRDTVIAGGGGSGGGGGGGSGGGGGYGVGTDFFHTTVFHHDNDSLYLCNNIIINNSVFINNTRPDADTVYNILVDQDSLFIDNKKNYMPRDSSIAVNQGANDCNSLALDLASHQRIYADIIDIGAYEQFVDETDLQFDQLVIHLIGDGQLQLCNNIIVNNPAHAEISNIEEIPENNILSDSIVLFRDANVDFSLWLHSPAVNAGLNSCCTLVVDIAQQPRIFADTIDVGAFEFSTPILFYDTVYTVMQGDTVELWLCNNILINNGAHSVNTNISNLSIDNIWQDNDSVFTDNRTNYLPLPQSIAVNMGVNDCNEVAVDLAKQTRIMADIIDIGAYEQFEDDEDSLVIAAVHQVDTTHQLRMYNNIVINNPGHTHNCHGSIVGSHNMLEDTPDVFVDMTSDYSLMEHSPAIDTGTNERVTWRYDLKDDERISCANIVDLGAFEYSYDNVAVALTTTEVVSDNCQGSYLLLQATPGAQHYYWSHTNEDTSALVVMPLVSTSYTVVATNGGACRDTASITIFPATSLNDSMGTPSSIGKVFWLSYLRNHFREPVLTVQLSAERACSGTVSNPITLWSVPFTVGAHDVTTVTIPIEQAYPVDANAVGNFGILVEATDTISVYAANYNHNSFDVTVVLPINALDDEYMLQTYTPTMNSEFVIVATEDNTEVEVTPARALMGGHAARQTFVLTMQRGQTYLGISRQGGVMGDLSGSIIKARDGKRVAVFNGNVCAMVPTDNSYTDHLVEQAVGAKYWGRSFALTTTEGQNFDMVRVTALRNNTVISKNGAAIATIQTGETYEFQLTGTEGSCYLETSQPAGVYLYIAGAVQGNNQELSDPSMIWIPPVEQQMNDLTFATFQSPGISDHYVNIVIPTDALEEVTLDNQLIGGEFTLMPANPQFAFVRKHIQPGTHTLHCSQGFIAHVYGLGYHESYGYAAGSKAEALKEQLFVNDIVSANLPANQQFCPYQPIDFRVEVNYSCDSVLWNFGDSTAIVNAMSTSHAYTEAGNYIVSATLYLTSGELVFCTNMYVRINVTDGFGDMYYDTVCFGEHYLGYGFDIEANEAGHFVHTRTVEIPGLYCDSTYILELEVLDNVLLIEDTICEQNPYVNHGFNLLPTTVGLLTDTLHFGQTSSGCDSMVILNLLVTPNMENIPDIIGETYPCVGEVFTYSLDSISGLQDVSWTIPDSVEIVSQSDDYHISLLFESSEENYEILVHGHNKCGDTTLRKMIYPQPYAYVQLVDTICSNERHYQKYGFDIPYVPDSGDVYVHHDVSSMGCDSTTVLAIVIRSSYHVYDTLLLCQDELPFLYHDTLIATAGEHDILLTTSLGCDSLVSLYLSVFTADSVEFPDTACFSINDQLVLVSCNGNQVTLSAPEGYNSYHWNNGSTSTTATYTVNGTTTASCLISTTDCQFTLVATLLTQSGQPTINSVIYDTICEGERYSSNYFNLPPQNEIGTHAFRNTFYNVNTCSGGCVSTTLYLTVQQSEYHIYDTACVGQNYNFGIISLPNLAVGEYNLNLPPIHRNNGCDSIVLLKLKVYPPFSIPNTITGDTAVCCNDIFTYTLPNADNVAAFHWNVPEGVNVISGQETPAVSLSFTDEAPNPAHITLIGTHLCGIDSVSLNVTHFPVYDIVIQDSICIGDEYHRYGFDLARQDSMGQFPYTNRDTTIHGCDSIVTLLLTVNSPTVGIDEQVACDSLTWLDGVTYYTSTNTPTYTYAGGAANGCDSIVSLNLTVNYTATGIDEQVACDSLTWLDGVTYYASINTPTYIYEGAATNGCDSVVTLHLTVNYTATGVDEQVACDSLTWLDGVIYYASTNTPTYTYEGGAANGCDSVVTLHLTVNYSSHNVLDTSACESYTWYDSTYVVTGTYTHAYTNAYGCASVDTLHLTVNYGTHDVYDTVVCESYDWHGTTYITSDTYTYEYLNADGCASVDTLHLTVYHVIHGDTTVVAYDSYTWNDSTYTISGNYTYSHPDANGCEQVDTLHLTVYYSSSNEFSDVACEYYQWNDSIYTTSGLYIQHFTDIHGADSMMTLHLTVNYGTHNVYDTVVCESYDWHGTTYVTSDTYTYEYTNTDGCASVDTLHLTVNYGTHNVYDTVVCESFAWHDSTYTVTGTYTYAYTNVEDCASVDTLHLTVNYTAIGVDEQVVCDSLTWLDGVTYYASTNTPTYTYVGGAANGCDSIVSLSLTVNYTATGVDEQVACDSLTWLDGMTYYASTNTPTYTYEEGAVNGCDSVVTLHLTVNYTATGIDEQVACDSLTWLDGVTYYASINTPTYTYVGGAANGCDSIVSLSLTVNYTATSIDEQVACDSLTWLDGVTYYASTNTPTYIYVGGAANGCDSVVTLHLTMNYSSHNVLDTFACESYTWHDSTYVVTGTYTHAYTNAYGCASVDTLHLTVNYGTHNVYDTVVCESYDWHGTTYVTSDTYTYEYTNTDGCASVDTLHLTVNYGTHNVYDTVVCESFAWHDSTYTVTGTYTYAYTNIDDCASVDTLHLTVNYIATGIDEQVACDSLTWLDGVTYYASTNTPTYTYEGGAANGCDSIVSLNLTVNYTATGIDEQVACDSLTWLDGMTYYASTNTPTYTYEEGAVNGCDSVVTLHLTVNYTATGIDEQVACDSLTWLDGVTYYASINTPTYTYVGGAANGCDSVVTLHLTVNYTATGIDEQVACDSLTWLDGVTYYASTNIPTYTFIGGAANGCDSIITLNLTIMSTPIRWDTMRIMRSQLPYEFVNADTVFETDVPDSFDFVWWAAAEVGCDTMVMQTVLVYPDLSLTATGTINTDCVGRNCFYNGPTIMINEVMLAPSSNDGSIAGNNSSKRGEWIELYNPHKCDSVDISCYYLGNNAYDGGNHGGGFVLPHGVIIPPQGFCMVRGSNAPAVPSELLVENGGNVVEVVVEDRYCTDGGTRLWFPNVGGWFAFYDANGVPQDAISWSSITSSCMSCHPCIPSVTDCGLVGELASYDEIQSSRKNYISDQAPDNLFNKGKSFRRIPDGGVWQDTPATPTYGTCNAECVDPAETTCNAIAIVSVSGGVPPYTYQWNDVYAQTTDTAFALCAGTYTVTVTDYLGNSMTAEVTIEDFVPDVSHEDASFCYADSSGVLQGFPAGGAYSGANVVNNVLYFEENVEEYQLSYTFVDSNGCSATSHFQVHVTDNTYFVDSVVCSNVFPFQWNGVTITGEGEYTVSLSTSTDCDSVVTLRISVSPLNIVEETLTICENDLPYTYGDTVFEIGTTSMSVHYIQNPSACDSVTMLTIELVPSSYNTLDTIVLENNLPLRINDSIYYAEDTYIQTLPNADVNGCDSLLTINMTVLYNDTIRVDTTICDDEFPFTWNDVLFTTAGTQNALYTAANGVDSVVVMTVNYNQTTYGMLDTIVFQNDLPLEINGESFSIPDIYTQHLTNAAGCDSILILNLIEIYNVTAFADSTICASATPFHWNGCTFTQTDVQVATLTASTGADSILVMTVRVIYRTYGSIDTTVVENDLPFTVNGYSYSTPSYYIQQLESFAGCDSLLTIHLTVLYNVTVPADSSICETELPLIWNGVTFVEDSVHQETHSITQSAVLTASTGVDSTVVMTVHVIPTTYGTIDTTVLENDLPLAINGLSYTLPDNYTQTLANASASGCDSVLTINMTVLYNTTEHVDSILCQSELPLTWNGVTFTADDFSGNAPTATDSALLTASNGVDSTVVMTVHLNLTTYGLLDTIVLENDLPLWLNGLSYMTDSSFTQTLVGANANGCDSILTVNMTVLNNVTVEVDSVICETELPLTWNGVTFVLDSIHQDSHSFTQSSVLTASTGVDSIVVMTVHVNYTTTGIDEQTACDNYTWIDGITYTVSTETATFILTNAIGCDSVVTLHLTIYHSALAQDTLVLVENQLPYYFAVADTVIAAGAPVESQFSYHLFTIHDCDSTIEQTVIVHYNTSETVDTTVCATSLPYTWHGHQFTQAGSYTDTLLNANGSFHYLTMQLAVSAPAVTMQNTHHVTCYGGSDGSVGVLVSDGTQPYSCYWENTNGTTVSSTAQLNNQPAGKYRLFVTDALGCQVVDSVTLIHLNDSMVPGVIASDQGVCEGANLQTFTGTVALGGAGSVYQWQISTNGTTWNPAPTPNNSQNYNYPQAVNSPFSLRRAWISTACGTVYSNVVNITVYHADEDTIFDEVCQGYPYQDNGFDISATATTTPGVLPCSIHLQNVHGCDSLVTLMLTINPTLYAEESITICQNELPYTYNDTIFMPGTPQLSTFSFHLSTYEGCDSIVTLHLTVNPSYEIELNDIVCEGDDYEGHGFFVPAVQTLGVTEVEQTLQWHSQDGCDSIVNLHLTVVDTAIAIVSLTSDFCEEYSAELSVETNMMNYLWSTGETSPTITVTQPGTYTVTATQDHCSVSAWYQIETCELNIYLPNTITPDEPDGLNDYFCLHDKYKPMIVDFEIRIYTRWGELIYYSNDKNFKWNGEHNGRINRNIIYTYLINFTDNRGIPYQLTGNIIVL